MSKKEPKLNSSHSAESDKVGPVAKVAEKAREFKDFFNESQVEIRKVVWPTRKETLMTCVAVAVLVVIMSLFLGVVDLGLSSLVEWILS